MTNYTAEQLLSGVPADIADNPWVMDAIDLLRERESGQTSGLVYVPGMWRCAKCDFVLLQSNLNAASGAVTPRDKPGDTGPNCATELLRVVRERGSAPVVPIPMILHCPSCGEQHIDAPNVNWDNPPHRSHLCHGCGTIWRPADVPTAGVERIQTQGKDDRVVPPAQPAVSEIIAELTKAVAKFPTWPTDPLHAVAVLNEECGELNKAVLQQVYEPHKNKPDDVRKEALQTAAMAIRFLLSLDVYKFDACDQHTQRKLSA